jgi:hypothetical protein
VQPRPTPAERADTEVDVEIDEALSVHVAVLEDWAATRAEWELTLHEGHEFGKANNVEARLVFAEGDQTSSLAFRLDQLTTTSDLGPNLVLVFEEQDGIAKMARLTAGGLDVELFHILTYT